MTRASAFEELGELEPALEGFRRALELEPSHPMALEARAAIERLKRRIADASGRTARVA